MGSFDFTITQKVVLLVALPVASFLLYFLLKKSNEDEEEPAPRVVTSRQTLIEVKVPKSIAGSIIGHKGCHIKELQDSTGARIQFKDAIDGEDIAERTVVIRGTEESTQQAERIILQIIAEQPVLVTETIAVPAKSIGRIIGRGGESIRSMCRISKANIQVPPEDGGCTSVDGQRVIHLKGTQDAIRQAKDLIREKLEEEKVFRARAAVNAANRQERGPRRKNGGTADVNNGQQAAGDISDLAAMGTEQQEKENIASVAEMKDQSEEIKGPTVQGPILPQEWPKHQHYLEVYISAVEHPGHFWVQVLSSKATQLDRLIQDMTDYYRRPNLAQDCDLKNLQVGDLVAAPFEHDTLWYRVRVIEVLEEKVDLYYVDFGDSCLVEKTSIMALRGDFLSLPFQAIEVQLAHVRPKGEEWCDEAIDVFEALVHSAKWIVMMARTITYEQTAEGSRPCLELVDTHGSKDLNVAEELVRRGFAEEHKETPEAAAPQANRPWEASPKRTDEKAHGEEEVKQQTFTEIVSEIPGLADSHVELEMNIGIIQKVEDSPHAADSIIVQDQTELHSNASKTPEFEWKVSECLPHVGLPPIGGYRPPVGVADQQGIMTSHLLTLPNTEHIDNSDNKSEAGWDDEDTFYDAQEDFIVGSAAGGNCGIDMSKTGLNGSYPSMEGQVVGNASLMYGTQEKSQDASSNVSLVWKVEEDLVVFESTGSGQQCSVIVSNEETGDTEVIVSTVRSKETSVVDETEIVESVRESHRGALISPHIHREFERGQESMGLSKERGEGIPSCREGLAESPIVANVLPKVVNVTAEHNDPPDKSEINIGNEESLPNSLSTADFAPIVGCSLEPHVPIRFRKPCKILSDGFEANVFSENVAFGAEGIDSIAEVGVRSGCNTQESERYGRDNQAFESDSWEEVGVNETVFHLEDRCTPGVSIGDELQAALGIETHFHSDIPFEDCTAVSGETELPNKSDFDILNVHLKQRGNVKGESVQVDEVDEIYVTDCERENVLADSSRVKASVKSNVKEMMDEVYGDNVKRGERAGFKGGDKDMVYYSHHETLETWDRYKGADRCLDTISAALVGNRTSTEPGSYERKLPAGDEANQISSLHESRGLHDMGHVSPCDQAYILDRDSGMYGKSMLGAVVTESQEYKAEEDSQYSGKVYHPLNSEPCKPDLRQASCKWDRNFSVNSEEEHHQKDIQLDETEIYKILPVEEMNVSYTENSVNLPSQSLSVSPHWPVPTGQNITIAVPFVEDSDVEVHQFRSEPRPNVRKKTSPSSLFYPEWMKPPITHCTLADTFGDTCIRPMATGSDVLQLSCDEEFRPTDEEDDMVDTVEVPIKSGPEKMPTDPQGCVTSASYGPNASSGLTEEMEDERVENRSCLGSTAVGIQPEISQMRSVSLDSDNNLPDSKHGKEPKFVKRRACSVPTINEQILPAVNQLSDPGATSAVISSARVGLQRSNNGKGNSSDTASLSAEKDLDASNDSVVGSVVQEAMLSEDESIVTHSQSGPRGCSSDEAMTAGSLAFADQNQASRANVAPCWKTEDDTTATPVEGQTRDQGSTSLLTSNDNKDSHQGDVLSSYVQPEEIFEYIPELLTTTLPNSFTSEEDQPISSEDGPSNAGTPVQRNNSNLSTFLITSEVPDKKSDEPYSAIPSLEICTKISDDTVHQTSTSLHRLSVDLSDGQTKSDVGPVTEFSQTEKKESSGVRHPLDIDHSASILCTHPRKEQVNTELGSPYTAIQTVGNICQGSTTQKVPSLRELSCDICGTTIRANTSQKEPTSRKVLNDTTVNNSERREQPELCEVTTEMSVNSTDGESQTERCVTSQSDASDEAKRDEAVEEAAAKPNAESGTPETEYMGRKRRKSSVSEVRKIMFTNSEITENIQFSIPVKKARSNQNKEKLIAPESRNEDSESKVKVIDAYMSLSTEDVSKNEHHLTDDVKSRTFEGTENVPVIMSETSKIDVATSECALLKGERKASLSSETIKEETVFSSKSIRMGHMPLGQEQNTQDHRPRDSLQTSQERCSLVTEGVDSPHVYVHDSAQEVEGEASRKGELAEVMSFKDDKSINSSDPGVSIDLTTLRPQTEPSDARTSGLGLASLHSSSANTDRYKLEMTAEKIIGVKSVSVEDFHESSESSEESVSEKTVLSISFGSEAASSHLFDEADASSSCQQPISPVVSGKAEDAYKTGVEDALKMRAEEFPKTGAEDAANTRVEDRDKRPFKTSEASASPEVANIEVLPHACNKDMSPNVKQQGLLEDDVPTDDFAWITKKGSHLTDISQGVSSEICWQREESQDEDVDKSEDYAAIPNNSTHKLHKERVVSDPYELERRVSDTSRVCYEESQPERGKREPEGQQFGDVRLEEVLGVADGAAAGAPESLGSQTGHDVQDLLCDVSERLVVDLAERQESLPGDSSREGMVAEWLSLQPTDFEDYEKCGSLTPYSSIWSEGSSSSDCRELLDACKGNESLDIMVTLDTSTDDVTGTDLEDSDGNGPPNDEVTETYDILEEENCREQSEDWSSQQNTKLPSLICMEMHNREQLQLEEGRKVESNVQWPEHYGSLKFEVEDNQNPELVSSNVNDKEYKEALKGCDVSHSSVSEAYFRSESAYVDHTAKAVALARDVAHLSPAFSSFYSESPSCLVTRMDTPCGCDSSGYLSEACEGSGSAEGEASLDSEDDDGKRINPESSDCLDDSLEETNWEASRRESLDCSSSSEEPGIGENGGTRHCSLYEEFQEMLEEVYGSASLTSTAATSYTTAAADVSIMEEDFDLSDSLEDLTVPGQGIYRRASAPCPSPSGISEDSLDDEQEVGEVLLYQSEGGADIWDGSSSFTDDSIDDIAKHGEGSTQTVEYACGDKGTKLNVEGNMSSQYFDLRNSSSFPESDSDFLQNDGPNSNDSHVEECCGTRPNIPRDIGVFAKGFEDQSPTDPSTQTEKNKKGLALPDSGP